MQWTMWNVEDFLFDLRWSIFVSITVHLMLCRCTIKKLYWYKRVCLGIVNQHSILASIFYLQLNILSFVCRCLNIFYDEIKLYLGINILSIHKLFDHNKWKFFEEYENMKKCYCIHWCSRNTKGTRVNDFSFL